MIEHIQPLKTFRLDFHLIVLHYNNEFYIFDTLKNFKKNQNLKILRNVAHLWSTQKNDMLNLHFYSIRKSQIIFYTAHNSLI